MARNANVTPIHGTSGNYPHDSPSWQTDAQDQFTKSLDEWRETNVRQHQMVDVAYGVGDTEKFENAEDYKMVVTADTGEPVQVVSSQFNLINNKHVVSLLRDVIDELNLGDAMWGEGRAYRDKFVVDLFFDKPDMLEAGRVFGVSVIAANDTSSSVRITPAMKFVNSDSVIRGIGGGWASAQHKKSSEEESKNRDSDLIQMFRETLMTLDGVADATKNLIDGASEFVINFEEIELTQREFYEIWLPATASKKLVTAAMKKSQERAGIISGNEAPNPSPNIDMWSLISGVTYGYTHASSLSDGSGLKGLHDSCIDALKNPEDTYNETVRSYFQQKEDEDTEQTKLGRAEKAALTHAETNVSEESLSDD